MIIRTLLYLFCGIFAYESCVFAFCEVFVRRYEKKHGIPHKLLSAISLIESGQKKDGHWVAWPWSINANGVPYVFDTKVEAITKVKELQDQGITSIDVGCMQINLKHHPDAFESLEKAFDPETNIAYAARFLKQKRDAQGEKGDWTLAAAHYHSATHSLNEPYKQKVLGTWKKILGQNDLPNAYEMVNKPSIVSVPAVALGPRQNPVNVRFSPFKLSRNALFQRRAGKEAPASPYKVRYTKGTERGKILSRERRIPLEIFGKKGSNPYSLKNSTRTAY